MDQIRGQGDEAEGCVREEEVGCKTGGTPWAPGAFGLEIADRKPPCFPPLLLATAYSL